MGGRFKLMHGEEVSEEVSRREHQRGRYWAMGRAYTMKK
jgi:hypothetical protein